MARNRNFTLFSFFTFCFREQKSISLFIFGIFHNFFIYLTFKYWRLAWQEIETLLFFLSLPLVFEKNFFFSPFMFVYFSNKREENWLVSKIKGELWTTLNKRGKSFSPNKKSKIYSLFRIEYQVFNVIN